VGVATMPAYGSVREKPRDRDREREREKERERRKEKEKDRDREQRRKARELEEREMDYLRRWDDIPISALFGKGKEKEKEREKEREREREKAKEKEREKRERYKERERLKDREQRGREKGKGRDDARSRSRTISVERRRQTQSEYRERTRSPRPDKGKAKERDTTTASTSTSTATQSQYQSHHRNRTRPDPKSKSYIPFTREEAELAGMKIICAKFKSAAAWEREQRDREARRAILRARMEGRLLAGAGSDGKDGAMASTTSFGSTSTLTLAGGGTAFGLSLGGGGGGEKERERRYTSTGPSLAAALASFVPPPPGAVGPPTVEPPSEGVQGHKSGVGVFEMDALHPHPQAPLSPPSEHHHSLNIPSLRKGSLPSLSGLGKLVGAGGSSTATDSMVGSPLNTNITPGGSVSGGGKFSMGLFGVGKDKDKDKEEDETGRATRKREERERKEKEKRQKAIEKELKKERKRREGGDWDEDEIGSSLSWRLGGGKRWRRGSIPTAKEDNEEWERSTLLEKMDPITFAPTPVKKVVVDDDHDDNEGDGRAFSKSMVSIPTIADSATLHDLDYMEPASPPLPSLPIHPTTTTPTKPKLHVSTSGIGPDAEIHTDSDSCSVDISSPVFAHSSDSEDDDAVRRAGYRYGGYHAKEKEKEKEKVKTKDVVDVDKAEEKPDTPAAAPVRRKEVDRGEWVILDMGNDHGVFCFSYHSQNMRY
jgi:hypothetical protein